MVKNNEIKNKKHTFKHWIILGIYVVSLLFILLLMWSFPKSNTLNVLLMFALAIVQLIYGWFEIKKTYNETKFQKYLSLGLGIYLFVMAIINLAFKLNEINTALNLIFIGFIILMSIIIKEIFLKLWNSESIPQIIFFYILFSIFLNYLFAFFYTLVSISSINSIMLNNNVISGSCNYVVFSFSNFYNSTQEYTSFGYSKIISLIQIASSYIFHTIILGMIIQKFNTCRYPHDK